MSKKLTILLVAIVSFAFLSKKIGATSDNAKVSNSDSEKFLPKNILLLDEKFAHHILLVEKYNHQLFLYENDNGGLKLLKTFNIATGKSAGDKKNQGDYKTPEGIYQLTDFFSSKQLSQKFGETAEMYGAGAFETNYPNLIDQRNSKTGSGIWLHSTDDDSRISKGLDSRGCVVVVDKDLKEIAKFIDLKSTSIQIVERIDYVSKSTHEKLKADILATVNNWQTAWKEKKIDQYLSHYSKEEFTFHKGNFNNFKNYKSDLFSQANNKWDINFSHHSILLNDEYAVVTMAQDYRGRSINDIGKKILYLKQNEDYKWKIVGEDWESINGPLNVAFTPSARFFSESGNNNSNSTSKSN